MKKTNRNLTARGLCGSSDQSVPDSKAFSRKAFSAAMAVLLIISFLTAVYQLKSDSRVVDIYAGTDDSAGAVVVTKYSSRTNAPIAGAEFALYRSYKGVGGEVKDSAPLAGYENLVSDEHGIIPKIDNTLAPGTYYLTETNPPPGHTGFDNDIIFTVSSLSTVELSNPDDQIRLITAEENENEVEKAYEIRLTDPFDYSTAQLTVSKTVEGTFGDKNREFTFTLDVDGAADGESYAWSKNGEAQSNRLHSGGSFMRQ